MKNWFKYMVLLACFPIISVSALSLSELYEQYDNITVERVSHVKKLDIALFPNKGSAYAWQ